MTGAEWNRVPCSRSYLGARSARPSARDGNPEDRKRTTSPVPAFEPRSSAEHVASTWFWVVSWSARIPGRRRAAASHRSDVPYGEHRRAPGGTEWSGGSGGRRGGLPCVKLALSRASRAVTNALRRVLSLDQLRWLGECVRTIERTDEGAAQSCECITYDLRRRSDPRPNRCRRCRCRSRSRCRRCCFRCRCRRSRFAGRSGGCRGKWWMGRGGWGKRWVAGKAVGCWREVVGCRGDVEGGVSARSGVSSLRVRVRGDRSRSRGRAGSS